MDMILVAIVISFVVALLAVFVSKPGDPGWRGRLWNVVNIIPFWWAMALATIFLILTIFVAEEFGWGVFLVALFMDGWPSRRS